MQTRNRGTQGQVAVVTGAVRGIGLGIARRLASDGCQIVVWDRDAAQFDVDTAGFTPVAVIAVDVADSTSVQRAYASTIERAQHLEILVNKAGINSTHAHLR